MNNKLLLSIGLVCAVNFSGCAVLNSMMTDESEFKEKASAAMDIPVEELSIDPKTIHPGLNDIVYDLKDKANNTYRCRFEAGMSGNAASQASCQKKVGNKWEAIGEQLEIESGFNWFGGNNGKSPASREPDMDFSKDKFKGSKTASKRTGQAFYVSGSGDDSQPAMEYVGGSTNTAVPTIVFTEDQNAAFKTNPTKTYNGKFKMRDEQGHSYECHFANVGQVVSDTISVCNKLY